MVDNVTFQDSAASTPPSNTVVATDNIGGVNYQRIKVTWGVDGTANDASAATPLPVDGSGVTQPISGTISGGASAASGGIASTSRLVSAAASTNSTSVKASAGRIYSIQLYNASLAVRYLKIYNKASAPTVGTDVPVKTIPLPPQAGMMLDWGNIGYYFSTGIGFGLTTGSADNDTGALTAADVVGLGIDYV